MAAEKQTLIGLFQSSFDCFGEQVPIRKIVIPIIQRDYAQGRKNAEITRVRTRFLDALYDAVTGTPVTLDFIYGDISPEGVLTPLDGQQRLTTLFLLHWYAAKRARTALEEYAFLKNFSYETRYSAREFCAALVDFTPSFHETISVELVDQPFFPLDWLDDATINAMLVMLDGIAEKFSGVTGLWERLKGGAVSFYFLPLKDMGLTDELYIRMNSRGRLLTRFEHFKAELERTVTQINVERAKQIIHKVDLEWTDLLWAYRDENQLVDAAFLRYCRFVCDLLCYREGGMPRKSGLDELDLPKAFFSGERAEENISFLEQCFDCWCDVQSQEGIECFFADRVTVEEHASGKILADDDPNYFAEALRGYGEESHGFTLGKTVLLYAFLVYLLHRDSIADHAFRRRLRIIRNLVDNSQDELSGSETRAGGNRIPDILKQVDSIIVNGIITDKLKPNFNAYQLSEEREKLLWTEAHPEQAETLYELEDHFLLYGQIGVVGLEHPEHFERFISLFDECDYDKIDCALIALGPSLQKEQNGWRYQSGSSWYDSAWKNLFHRSGAEGFERTKEALGKLLSLSGDLSNERLDRIASRYIEKCIQKSRFDWRYYYLKYEVFRPGRYGKYWWSNYEKAPYQMVVLWAERNTSSNAYQPFLKAVDEDERISRADGGMCLVFRSGYLECENDAYVLRSSKTDKELRRLQIEQTSHGIDREDRIQKFLSWKDRPK